MKTFRPSQAARGLAEDAIREVRVLSYLMHPPMLDEAGLGPRFHGTRRGFPNAAASKQPSKWRKSRTLAAAGRDHRVSNRAGSAHQRSSLFRKPHRDHPAARARMRRGPRRDSGPGLRAAAPCAGTQRPPGRGHRGHARARQAAQRKFRNRKRRRAEGTTVRAVFRLSPANRRPNSRPRWERQWPKAVLKSRLESKTKTPSRRRLAALSADTWRPAGSSRNGGRWLRPTGGSKP